MNARTKTSAKNSWFGFAAVASISFLLCMAINLRAFSEMRQEANHNEQISLQIETLTTENLALQEEIQDLRKDDTRHRARSPKDRDEPSERKDSSPGELKLCGKLSSKEQM